MIESTTVIWSWQVIGEVAIAESKLVFPRAPNVAGVYRFESFERNGDQLWVYVGEADALPRRFQHYRTPGPSQQTNLRINPIMYSAVADGGRIEVAIATQAHAVAADGSHTSLDLTWKSARVLVERAAEVGERLAGTSLLNR